MCIRDRRTAGHKIARGAEHKHQHMTVYYHHRNFHTLLYLHSSVNLYLSMPAAHHPRQLVMVNEADIGVCHGLVESM